MVDRADRAAGAGGIGGAGDGDRRRRLVVLAVAVVVVLAAAASIATYRATKGGPSVAHRDARAAAVAFTLHGLVREDESTSSGDLTGVCPTNDDGTVASFPGAPVVQVLVRDARGDVVGLGSLGPEQRAGAFCTRSFTVPGVPTASRFDQLEVVGHATRWLSAHDAAQFVQLDVAAP